MPDISISEDQRERLEWVQSRLSEDVEYGHVRPCDALEYLLDRFDDQSGEIDVSATLAEGDTERSAGALGNGGSDPVDEVDADTDTDTDTGTDTGTDTVTHVEPAAFSRVETDTTGDDDTDGTDPETTLNSMMSLLEDNTDVWRESSAGEEKYEVDLPDGSTERARTKDDVRALLFKHYR